MLNQRIALVSLALTFALSSCSKEQGGKKVYTKGAVGETPATEATAEASKALSLTALAGEASKDFVSAPTFQWNLSATQLVLNRADGSSLSYNRERGEWGPVESFSDGSSYDSLYAYGDRSFVGLKSGVLNLRVASGKVLAYDLLKIIPESPKIFGIGPGFFAVEATDGILVTRADTAAASSIKIKGSPKDLVEIGLCLSACVLWAYDGKLVHTYDDKNVWTSHALPFQVPEGKTMTRIALNLKLNEKSEIILEHAAALSEDGQLYLSARSLSEGRKVTFEEVKALTTRDCILCHTTEAFDQEAGLKAMKTKIVTRLTLDSANPLVMPPKSSDTAMSGAEKSLIVSWLSQQTEGVDIVPDGGGKPTKPTPADPKTTPITGIIATQSDKHCLSCHPKAKFQDFWMSNKSDISSRVTSGNMPAGKTLSDADKSALLKAVDDLK